MKRRPPSARACSLRGRRLAKSSSPRAGKMLAQCAATPKRSKRMSRKGAPTKRGTVRRNPSEDHPWVSFSGFITPTNTARFLRTVAERAPENYRVAAWDSSQENKVMRRRKVPQTGYDGRGAPRFEIPRKRLPRLLLSLVNSRRYDERDVGSSIAYTLNIELI